jgi:hypothetical protein
MVHLERGLSTLSGWDCPKQVRQLRYARERLRITRPGVWAMDQAHHWQGAPKTIYPLGLVDISISEQPIHGLRMAMLDVHGDDVPCKTHQIALPTYDLAYAEVHRRYSHHCS